MRSRWLYRADSNMHTLPITAILPTMDAGSFRDAVEIGASLNLDDVKQSAILAELDRIIESKAFRTSRRSRQFLSYVVRQTLDGKGELLKERTIGTDVFGRTPEGITTENSLVRKQAGVVRRRLEQYYEDPRFSLEKPAVRILLPVGSYVPEFCFRSEESSIAEASPISPEQHAAVSAARMRLWIPICAVLLVAALSLGGWIFHRHTAPDPLFARFWAPVSSSPESVVVCLAKPVVYIPSHEFYQKYAQTHDRDFGLEWQRLNKRLPKDLDPAPGWADMRVQEDYGIARGDADAAFKLATLFGRLGKSSQLRIGENCSLADLRSAPVTLIGAYNNRWTMELMSVLHFRFQGEDNNRVVEEQAPSKRIWKTEWNASTHPSPWSTAADQQPKTDFAIVSRLKNSQTGHYITIVAGITGPGTQAAAEFVSNPRALSQALQQVTPGWEDRNLQLVLRVTVPDGITPTSPQMVAFYTW
jgi:hypothetical protein